MTIFNVFPAEATREVTMNGAAKVFYVYAELIDEARRRACVREGQLFYVRDTLTAIRQWVWNGDTIPEDSARRAFAHLAVRGFELATDERRVAVADVLTAVAWLARAVELALIDGRTLTPSLAVTQAVGQCDRFLVVVFDRTGLIGNVSVPGFIAWALSEPEEVQHAEAEAEGTT